MTAIQRRVKIAFQGDIRRASITTTVDGTGAFESLVDLIARLFGKNGSSPTAELKIWYKDDEGDRVRILSNEELLEAFEVAKEKKTTLKLHLQLPGKPTNGSSEAKKAPAKMIAATVSKTEASSPSDSGWEQVRDGNDERKKTGKNAGFEKPKETSTRSDESKKEVLRENKNQRGGNWNNNPRGGYNWRAHRRNWREQARENKAEFREEMKDFFSNEKIIAAIQESIPEVVDKVIKGETLSSVIDSVLESRPALKGHPLTERIVPLAKNLSDLLPSGVIGPMIIDTLLELQSMLQDGKLNEKHPFKRFRRLFCNAMRTARHGEDRHHGIACDECGQSPIVGTRWKKRGENYDLCDTDYKKLNDEEKKAYRSIKKFNGPCGFGGGMGFHPAKFAAMFMGGGPRGRHCGFGGSPFRSPPCGDPFGSPPFGRTGGRGAWRQFADNAHRGGCRGGQSRNNYQENSKE